MLSAATAVATAVKVEQRSVLIHCSDGWDRTSQVASLASLLLDPYYRTLQGFAVLVEKEWLSFGHQFATRLGHGQHSVKRTQYCSPVFVQWLDAVWQVVDQFPSCFEFDERYLITLIDLVRAQRPTP